MLYLKNSILTDRRIVNNMDSNIVLSPIARQSKYLDDSLISAIERRYNQNHRYYHTLTHINSMIVKMIRDDIFSEELLLAILFHDIVYWPRNDTNEVESVDLFRTFASFERSDNKIQLSSEMIENITVAIMDTVTHIPTTKLSEELCYLDLNCLNGDFESVLDFESKIFDKIGDQL